MNKSDRNNYGSEYGKQCLAALLLFGYPPGFPATGEEWTRYWRDVREWWLTTQNPDIAEQCAWRGEQFDAAVRFASFFGAWCRDQKQRSRRDGII